MIAECRSRLPNEEFDAASFLSFTAAVTTEGRAALDALRDLRRVPERDAGRHYPPDSLIFAAERSEDFEFVRLGARASMHEPPRVRALLGLIGTLLVEDASILAKLRHSLNTTTTFKLGLAVDFAAAADWGIA